MFTIPQDLAPAEAHFIYLYIHTNAAQL